MLVFDIETDGFLDVLTQVHCLVICDTKTGEVFRFNSQRGDIEQGLRMLEDASEIGGHNILTFDIPAIQKVYRFRPKHTRVRDSLIYSRLAYPDLFESDCAAEKKRRGAWIPKHMYGRHGLEAWGERRGIRKGDYAKAMKDKGQDPWANWNQDMEDYCEQDVRLNVDIFEFLQKHEISPEALQMEHDVQRIIFRQERRGFSFDVPAAGRLYGQLAGAREKLRHELEQHFGSWYASDGVMKPKRDNKKMGYIKDAPFTRLVTKEFSASNRFHIADRLIKVYGWKPTEFTPKGQPKVDETVLEGLTFPIAKAITEYLTLDKRIAQLAEGKEAWLRCEQDGRIHGGVNTIGAVTGRMTHSKPNLAQVPACGTLYGPECRKLFTARQSYKLLGVDASGLELRCLAHYMAIYDNGEYARNLLEGDVHTETQKALGFNERNNAKTFIYAFLYGAGNGKLGAIVFNDYSEKQKAKLLAASSTGALSTKVLVSLGRRARTQVLNRFPALRVLTERIKATAVSRGYLKGLDGRKLKVRSSHAALNTLLQSAGALVMKQALVILDDNLVAAGFTHSDISDDPHYEFVCNIHDEFQIEVKEEMSEQIAKEAINAIRMAGERFRFRIGLDAGAAIGETWADTH